MQRQERSTRESTPSRMRSVLETVLFRTDGRTIIEECRRCGTTLESNVACCPACGRDDIVRYRLE